MRKCLRCGCEMTKKIKHPKKGDLDISLTAVAGEYTGDVTANTNDDFFKPYFEAKIKVAICPNCGEVSLYTNKK